jgi:hypothetical protein
MATKSFLASESTHELLEMEDDLMKPINENRTNPKLQNPFVLEHNFRLSRKNEESVDDSHLVTQL